MLRNDARELYLPAHRLSGPFYHPYISIPSLTKLVIYELHNELELDLPPLASNIRVLELQITNDRRINRLLKGLSSPDLQELKLMTTGGACLHKILTDRAESQALLAKLFPNVERLHLECERCPQSAPRPYIIWRAVKEFSKLRDVTLTETVPEEAIEKLRHLERVAIVGGSLFELVKKIPDRIVGVVTSRSWYRASPTQFILHESHLQLLEQCTRLKSLNCCIKEGTEYLLAPIVKNLRHLGVALEGDFNSNGDAIRIINPMRGALLNAIKEAPSLKSIRFEDMRIGRDELQKILVARGNQLEEFTEQIIAGTPENELFAGLTIFFSPQIHRAEHEVREAIATLRTAALHNSSLRRFKIDMPPMCALRLRAPQRARDFEQAMELLQRRAPQLDVSQCMADLKYF